MTTMTAMTTMTIMTAMATMTIMTAMSHVMFPRPQQPMDL